MNPHQYREPPAGAHVITADSDIDPSLLSAPLDPRNAPTGDEKALEVSILWGDTVVSEAQVHAPGPVTVGDRTQQPPPTLEVDGGFPVSRFTLATLDEGEAQIIVPRGAQVRVRSAAGAVDADPRLEPAEPGFDAGAYRLRVGERLVYKSGTVTVMAQFVRGNAVLGQAGLVTDWIFPAILTISLLLHSFFIIATFIAPERDDAALQELYKNKQRYAQMILTRKPPPKKRRRLDLSGMKKGGKTKRKEGKFGKRDKKPEKRAPSKPGTPRVDPKKRERDRKAALSSGLLAMLDGKQSSDVSNVLGPGGLGTGINKAMGGLRGTRMGNAGGSAGFGTRGGGRGGGGQSLGIGDVGNGTGRGRGGGGDIDLGGRGKGRTRIQPGRTIVKGSLSKAEIGRVIRRNLPRFKHCYEKELNKNPDLGGKVAVYFTIAPTGSVAQAKVRETSMDDTNVESCVVKVMKSLKFPKPKGGGIVVVTYPFVFAAT